MSHANVHPIFAGILNSMLPPAKTELTLKPHPELPRELLLRQDYRGLHAYLESGSFRTFSVHTERLSDCYLDIGGERHFLCMGNASYMLTHFESAAIQATFPALKVMGGP